MFLNVKNSLFIFYIVFINFHSFSQEKNFGKTFAVGSSLTYMWDIDGGKKDGFHYYNLFVWNTNVSMRLSKKFWLGLQINPIFTKEFTLGTIEKKVYNFNGLYTQYDFLYKNGLRIYAETSINLSNYCTCDSISNFHSPFERKGLLFWGGGGGFEFVLNKNKGNNLLLELAFFNNVIIQKVKYKYNFTQYIIGLNYRFGKLD